MLSDLGVDSYAGTPLRGADGQAHGLLVIMHDRPMDASRHHPCTILDLVAGRAAAELERSRVEEQLRKSEEQIRFLSESTPALLWRATPDGRLDYLSPRAAEYRGVPDRVAPWPRVRGAHASRRRRAQAAVVEGRARNRQSVRSRVPPARREWHLPLAVDASAAEARRSPARSRKWYGSVVDVDDKRRAEEALREADRRKDEFLAMLAHELRNPLAPIRHALTVQARSEDVEVWTEMRQTMERQVQHLVRLVDDLLDVSRLTMGRITLRREPVDVRDIVADALETCREAIEAKEHRVTTRVPSEALVVDGDRIRLVQILTNILNNAAKFTEPGGEIDIAATRSGDVVEIRVRDSGVGISEERLPRIFDLFSQSDPSPTAPTAVSASDSRSRADLSTCTRATLTASSAGPGRGSEFRIALRALTTAPIRQRRHLFSQPLLQRNRPPLCACSSSTTTWMPRGPSSGSFS